MNAQQSRANQDGNADTHWATKRASFGIQAVSATDAQDANGDAPSGPRIIEVQGATMEDGGEQYQVTIMGNTLDAGQNNNTEKGQLEPLKKTLVSPDSEVEISDETKTLVNPDNEVEIGDETKTSVNPENDVIISDETKTLVKPENDVIISDETKTLINPENDIIIKNTKEETEVKVDGTDSESDESEDEDKKPNDSVDKDDENNQELTKIPTVEVTPTHVSVVTKIDDTDDNCNNNTPHVGKKSVTETEEHVVPVNNQDVKEVNDNDPDTINVEAKANGKETNNTSGTPKLGTKLTNSENDEKDGKVVASNKNDDDFVVFVAGKDDVDAASTYSLYMERDFRYYFQHPWCRLLFSYFVIFCNFLIYAEDPVAHSIKECYIPLVGNDIAFMMTRYPSNAWSLLKVLLWLVGLLVGMIIGKLLVHKYLFCKLFRIKMFSDDQGSWMMMFFGSLISVFVFSWVYNLFLLAGGDDTDPYRISHLMGVSNNFFMKVAACGTWSGDFFTAWMVTDIMLQEKLYPGWARPVRTWWKKGWNRIILFWIVTSVTSVFVLVIIATDFIQWDKLNRDFMPTNEVSRAFLASFILVMDLMIVMQDWDFPHFVSAIDIKLPGLNVAHIRFQVPIPKFLKKEHWQVHITGKWFNYGILFVVMLLDLNMWKNQIFYLPFDYGQYTGPGNKIYSVQDQYSLDTFNKSQLTFDFRNSTINPNTNLTFASTDTHMNTRYNYSSLAVKCIAFIPCITAFITFGILIFLFGRYKPTPKDPYAGRLKKRRKKISFRSLRRLRMPWKRKQEVTRKIHAVPKLLYFKKKRTKRGDLSTKHLENPPPNNDEAIASIEVTQEIESENLPATDTIA